MCECALGALSLCGIEWVIDLNCIIEKYPCTCCGRHVMCRVRSARTQTCWNVLDVLTGAFHDFCLDVTGLVCMKATSVDSLSHVTCCVRVRGLPADVDDF